MRGREERQAPLVPVLTGPLLPMRLCVSCEVRRTRALRTVALTELSSVLETLEPVSVPLTAEWRPLPTSHWSGRKGPPPAPPAV